MHDQVLSFIDTYPEGRGQLVLDPVARNAAPATRPYVISYHVRYFTRHARDPSDPDKPKDPHTQGGSGRPSRFRLPLQSEPGAKQPELGFQICAALQ